MSTDGRTAYQAWAHAVLDCDTPPYDGLPLWDELSEDAQGCWSAAAAAVCQSYLDHEIPAACADPERARAALELLETVMRKSDDHGKARIEMGVAAMLIVNPSTPAAVSISRTATRS